MNGILNKARDRFSETEIDAEIVVMQLDSGVFFSLRGTARRIWELIDGTRDRDALIGALIAEFADDDQRIVAEAEAFLAQLNDAGLITAQ